VNVSVRGGNRVEIKGVPRAGLAVKLVHNEGVRQYNLLKLRDQLHRRGLTTPDAVRVESFDVSDIWAGVDLGFVRRALQAGGKVYAVRVDGAAGLAQHPTQPDTTFLDELAGRIRVIACLDEVPIVFSGALFPQFQTRNQVLDRVRKRARVGTNDDVFIVCGPEEDVRTAAEEIRLRFVDAVMGVPKETRQALVGGYTTFERILPGPDRMYPDTDSPPTSVTEERVARIKARLQPSPWDRIERYMSWRVPEETCNYLIRRGGADILDTVITTTGVDGLTAAIEIGQRAKALARAGIPMSRLGTAEWVQVFDLYTDGRIPREAIPVVATRMATDGLTAAAACAAEHIALVGREVWAGEIGRPTLDGYLPAKADSRDRRLRFLAGRAMETLKGRAPARDVAAYLSEQLEEVAR
jgi:glutamyl-tRNA(Gln) amidotransferase subunit E